MYSFGNTNVGEEATEWGDLNDLNKYITIHESFILFSLLLLLVCIVYTIFFRCIFVHCIQQNDPWMNEMESWWTDKRANTVAGCTEREEMNGYRKILEIATHHWLCIVPFHSVLICSAVCASARGSFRFFFCISNPLAPLPSHLFHSVYSCIHAYKCVSLKQKPNLVCKIIVLRFIFRSIHSG